MLCAQICLVRERCHHNSKFEEKICLHSNRDMRAKPYLFKISSRFASLLIDKISFNDKRFSLSYLKIVLLHFFLRLVASH